MKKKSVIKSKKKILTLKQSKPLVMHSSFLNEPQKNSFPPLQEQRLPAKRIKSDDDKLMALVFTVILVFSFNSFGLFGF